MAEKVATLNLERDYKKYLYFVDGNGSVCRKSKSHAADDMEAPEVIVPNAVVRDNQFLYFVDKEGDVSRSPRAIGRKKALTA